MNVYLVRHAHAGDRSRWGGPDADRPLSAKGHARSDDLADAFASLPIGRVLSSPAARCQQTVAALAARHGLPVEVVPAFAEGAACSSAHARLDELLVAGTDAVVCTHGDVLPAVLDALASEGVRIDGSGCAKGSVWHLSAPAGRFERATYHRHPAPGLLPSG